MTQVESLFLSILGAPASGKSYLLTAMAWEMRKTLPLKCGVDFADTDPEANRALGECEEMLYLNPNPDQVVPLGGLRSATPTASPSSPSPSGPSGGRSGMRSMCSWPRWPSRRREQ